MTRCDAVERLVNTVSAPIAYLGLELTELILVEAGDAEAGWASSADRPAIVLIN